MATDGALKSVGRYFAFYSALRVTPIKWNSKEKRMSVNPDKLAWAHLYCSWSLGWVVCIYGAFRLLKEMYNRDENFDAFQIIMYIFYNLIIFIACMLSSIFIFHVDSVCNASNMGFIYDLSNKEKFCWEGKKKKGKVTFTEKVLLYLIPGSIFGSVCGGLISFAFPVDPFQRFVVDHFPEIYMEYKFYIKFVSFFVIIICGCYIWNSVILIMTLAVIYSTGLAFWLSCLNGKNTTEDGKMAQRRLMKQPLSSLMVYKAAQILNAEVMKTIIFAPPVIFGIGSIIAIVCNFATVKMYDIIPMPGYLLMPLVSTFIHGMLLVFTPRAANFYVQSKNCLLTKRNVEDPYLRRVAKGCRIISFDVGPFSKLHQGSTLQVNGFIIDYSIDLIMSIDMN